MKKQIEDLFSALITQPKISWAEITNFGSQIALNLLNSSDEVLKNTLDNIYLGLLRKGNVAFDAFDSNYDDAARKYLRTGINETIRNTIPLDQAYDFSCKLKLLSEEKYDTATLITKEVAIGLGEKVDDETMNLKLHHLSDEIIRFTFFSHTGCEKTNKQITEYWNNAYDEFAFHNRLDLIPQLADITIKKISDFLKFDENKAKAVIQGLSNLKDAQTDTLDFSQLLEKLMETQPKDSISLLVNKYLTEPTDNMLNIVIKKLTEEIISQDPEKQSLLWNRVREEFLTPVFKNGYVKNNNISTKIVMIAVDFIKNSEERDALISGISGVPSIIKRENLSASIINMRHKFTGENAIPMKKLN